MSALRHGMPAGEHYNASVSKDRRALHPLLPLCELLPAKCDTRKLENAELDREVVV